MLHPEVRERVDINNLRQNHPELIVNDLKSFVPPELIRQVLKYRGVNKWFRVRRLLIQLKARWLVQIKELQTLKAKARTERNYAQFCKLQGYVEALIDCRQQVRALTHSPRDVDFPISPKDFGWLCDLPLDFPSRPHKRWFRRHNDATS